MTHASTTGNYAYAPITTGDRAHASTTGDEANASTTGDRANASTTGDRANASTTGDLANASTTGYGAHASTTGFGAAAVSVGLNGLARCGPGGAICLAHLSNDGSIRLVVGHATDGEEYGFVRLAFADKVRQLALEINPVVGTRYGSTEYLSSLVRDHGWDEAKKEPEVRKFLQNLGAGCREVFGERCDIQPGVWYDLDESGELRARPDILLPDDGRGYTLTYKDGVYTAGCRTFTAAEAVAHWTDPEHAAPESAAALAQAVIDNETRLGHTPL